MEEVKILIERTTETGYEEKEYPISEVVHILNTELENGRSIWIDNKLFGEVILGLESLDKCKKVCVTNRLIGG